MRGMILAAVALLAGCSLGADVPAAQSEIDKFHRQLDGAQYAAIYRSGAVATQSGASEGEWTNLLKAVHTKLGKFKSGASTGWLENWNNGLHALQLTYDSTYERGSAREQFVFYLDTGKPLLAGYHLSSNELITNEPIPDESAANRASNASD